MLPVFAYRSQLQSNVVHSKSNPNRLPAASRTRIPSGTTSLPIPSPGITAIRCAIFVALHVVAEKVVGVRCGMLVFREIASDTRRTRVGILCDRSEHMNQTSRRGRHLIASAVFVAA